MSNPITVSFSRPKKFKNDYSSNFNPFRKTGSKSDQQPNSGNRVVVRVDNTPSTTNRSRRHYPQNYFNDYDDEEDEAYSHLQSPFDEDYDSEDEDREFQSSMYWENYFNLQSFVIKKGTIDDALDIASKLREKVQLEEQDKKQAQLKDEESQEVYAMLEEVSTSINSELTEVKENHQSALEDVQIHFVNELEEKSENILTEVTLKDAVIKEIDENRISKKKKEAIVSVLTDTRIIEERGSYNDELNHFMNMTDQIDNQFEQIYDRHKNIRDNLKLFGKLHTDKAFIKKIIDNLFVIKQVQKARDLQFQTKLLTTEEKAYKTLDQIELMLLQRGIKMKEKLILVGQHLGNYLKNSNNQYLKEKSINLDDELIKYKKIFDAAFNEMKQRKRKRNFQEDYLLYNDIVRRFVENNYKNYSFFFTSRLDIIPESFIINDGLNILLDDRSTEVNMKLFHKEFKNINFINEGSDSVYGYFKYFKAFQHVLYFNKIFRFYE